MKSEFKAKFLQHVAKKKREEGFTLIELLVVIIIIGILSAIALPSFLNQANKAKQSEAKQYLASINKGQQAHYAENGSFIVAIANIGDLGLGIKTETSNYTYDLGGTANTEALSWTQSTAGGLSTYSGLVFLSAASGSNTSQTILCEGPSAGGAIVGPTAGATDCANAGLFTTPL